MANGFRPAEDLLQLFSQAWACGVTRNSGSAAVNRRLPVCAVLGHLRHRLQDKQRMDKVSDILALGATHAQAVSAGNPAYSCHRSFLLRRAGNRSEAGVARLSKAVSHQHLPLESNAGLDLLTYKCLAFSVDLGRSLIEHLPNRPERIVLGYSIFEVKATQHAILTGVEHAPGDRLAPGTDWTLAIDWWVNHDQPGAQYWNYNKGSGVIINV